MENKGQVECDTFNAGGAIAGAEMVALRQGVRQAGWKLLVGGAGAGSLVGVVGYMGWRYGIEGGTWEQAALALAEELNTAMSIEGRQEKKERSREKVRYIV